MLTLIGGGYRYDFMSDMVFGGGSEILTAGNDRGNVWSVIEDAMLCVHTITSSERCSACGDLHINCLLSDSIATFFGHVPWLGVYVGKIPGATGSLEVLLSNSIQRATARLKRGSERKDLFHYLVSPVSSPHRRASSGY